MTDAQLRDLVTSQLDAEFGSYVQVESVLHDDGVVTRSKREAREKLNRFREKWNLALRVILEQELRHVRVGAVSSF